VVVKTLPHFYILKSFNQKFSNDEFKRRHQDDKKVYQHNYSNTSDIQGILLLNQYFDCVHLLPIEKAI